VLAEALLGVAQGRGRRCYCGGSRSSM
jgi:hypothetical protein